MTRVTVERRGDLKLVARGGYWYARGTMYGDEIFVSTKTKDRARARVVLREIERQVERGIQDHTFAQACDDYAAHGGQRTYLGALTSKLGKRKLNDIRQTDLDETARELYGHTSRETQNRQAYTPFIAVWNHAVGNEWTAARTWRRPRKPKGTLAIKPITRAGTQAVTYEHAWAFIRHMSPAPAELLATLFYTGMRPIELFALRSEHVDISNRWITVLSSKTGEPRGVPIHDFLVPLLERLRGNGGVMFRTIRGLPYRPREGGGGQLRSAIAGARERSGIKDVSLYTARHTVSTQLVIASVHPHIKDQILGHAADNMSRRYTHVPQSALIEAINTLPVIDEWREAVWMR
ncbi:tyrosine-type recombinase/integrase [Devosia naphthalenivorans]|uniref:tyrosine-type recombinase/integrase n=1 Tax=Devosia naphthalenivorans TaxID=2082392 RepID=UPI0013B06AE0|nr:site-specific integrase [Devosia naphthalenivorans]